jgi:hypothetical protein
VTPTKPTRGYPPSETPQPVRLTFGEYAQFKKLFEESSLAWYVKAAAWGAMLTVGLEIIRLVWLALRYFGHFNTP